MSKRYDHEQDKMQEEHLEVVESADQNRPYWASRPYLSEEIKASIAHAAVVIVPREGFRDHAGPVFPVGTEELLRLLEERLPADATVEIAVDDNEYHELALHSSVLIIGTFIVTSFAAPLVVNLISDYVNRRSSQKDKASVRFELKVEDNLGRTTSISYDGPAQQFEKSVGQALALLQSPKAGTARPRLGSGDDSK